jgi:lysophospholipase L1-like esterase
MRGARRAALGAIACALVLSALLPATGVGAGRFPYSRTLLVVGDSLAVGTRPYLPRFLHGWHVHQVVSISKQAPQGPAALRRYGRRLPRVVFVNLGTNGSPQAVGLFERSIRRTMRVAGPRRCVVWSNIVRPRVGGASYARLNRALARQAKARRNLIVFRWVRLARRLRGAFAPDGVHVTGAGYRIRAREMAKSVQACRRIAVRYQRRTEAR